MHVVLTVNVAWNIANFRMPIVEALLAEGHQVTVLAPHDDTVPRLRSLGVNFVDLKMDAKGLNPIGGIDLVMRMKRHFKTLKPDCVLSYTIKNNTFGAIAAKSLGIPFLPNVSGLGTAFLSGNAMRKVAEALYRRAFRSLNAVFFQNDEDAALFLERRLVAPSQVRIVPGSGIDLTHFHPAPLPHGPSVFLMIGRVLRDKGILEYVAAARHVKSVHPSCRFQLLGAADAANRTAIGQNELESWVTEGILEYLGTTDDVRPAIANASCIVLPSYREGAPRTLIEGAAMARPLIATDVPGCRTVVDHGQTGYLVKARNAQALADAMLEFVAMPPEAQIAFGNAGRLKIEKEFDKQLVVEAYLTAIKASVSRR